MEDSSNGRSNFFNIPLHKQEDIIESAVHHVVKITGLEIGMVSRGAALMGIVHEAIDIFGAQSLCFVVVIDLDDTDASLQWVTDTGRVEFVHTKQVSNRQIYDEVVPIMNACFCSKPGHATSNSWVAKSKWTSDRKLIDFSFG